MKSSAVRLLAILLGFASASATQGSVREQPSQAVLDADLANDSELAYRLAGEQLARCAGEPAAPDQCFILMLQAAQSAHTTDQPERGLEHAEAALKLAEGLPGQPRADVAAALAAKVYNLRALERSAEAEPLEQRALKLLEQVPPGQEESAGRALNLLAMSLADHDRPAEAEPLQRRAIELIERIAGADSLRTASLLGQLSWMLEQLGRQKEAEPILRRTLAVREKLLGPHHPRTIKSLSRMGELLVTLDRATEAETFQRRAVEAQSSLDPKGSEAAEYAWSLAKTLEKLERHSEAELSYRQVLASEEARLGAEHPDVGITAAAIGDSLAAQQKPDEAAARYERALAIARLQLAAEEKKAAGKEEGEALLAPLERVASLLRHKLGRLSDSIPVYQRILAITERVKGPQSAETADVLKSLGDVTNWRTEPAKAESYYRRALAVEQKRAPEDPFIGNIAHNLGLLLSNLGRVTEARPLFELAVSIREKELGPAHPDTFVARMALAEAFPLDQSIERFAAIHSSATHTLGAEHAITKDSAEFLSNRLGLIGRYDEAEKLLVERIGVKDNAISAESLKKRSSVYELIRLRLYQGRYADAERVSRKMLEVTEEAVGPDHPDTGDALDMTARTLAVQGRHPEAIALSRRALKIYEAELTPTARRLTPVLRELALSLDALGRFAEAEPLYRRSFEIAALYGGDETIDGLWVKQELARNLLAQRKAAEAESLYKEIVAWAERTFGKENVNLGTPLTGLARALRGERRNAEAEPLLRRAMAVQDAGLPRTHRARIETGTELGSLLLETGRPKLAVETLREVRQAVLAARDGGAGKAK